MAHVLTRGWVSFLLHLDLGVDNLSGKIQSWGSLGLVVQRRSIDFDSSREPIFHTNNMEYFIGAPSSFLVEINLEFNRK